MTLNGWRYFQIESFIKSYNEESDDGYLGVRKQKSEFENYKNV